MKLLLSLILALFCANLFGQMYDAQWAINYYQSVVDFRVPDTVSLYAIPTIEYSLKTDANICDKWGNLLYYTNGMNICNVNDSLVNGTGLNPCPFTDDYVGYGLPIQQAALFIPKPGDTAHYYLFHFSFDAPDESRPWTIYYSEIDRNGDSGRGAVIKKNVPIFTGAELRGGGMTACKHANGRDYWLIMGGSLINTFYKFLVTPDTVLGPFTQNIGSNFFSFYDLAYSKFSLDGSKFATGIWAGAPVEVLDFDRCTGEFSNPVYIYNDPYIDTSQGDSIEAQCISLEFSPNGRFLYVSNTPDLHQYDLWSDSTLDSVLIYPTSTYDTGSVWGVGYLQLGPNGKLYTSTWIGGLKAYSVINYPDLKGDSSNFVFAGQPTLTLNSSLVPNMINYKLGPLVGSGCDTIPPDTTNGITQIASGNLLRVMPNPADKYLYVEMGRQGDYLFQLYNSASQLVATRKTRQVDNFDTEGLASGEYVLLVTDKITQNAITRKVVVQH